MKISFDCESGRVSGDVRGQKLVFVDVSVDEEGAMIIQLFTGAGQSPAGEVVLSPKTARLLSNVRYSAMESE